MDRGQATAGRGASVLPGVPTDSDRTRFAALIEALPEPVMLVGADRNVVLANAAAREMFGERIAGSPILAMIRQPEPAAVIEAAFARLADPGAPGGPFEARKTRYGETSEVTYRLTVMPLSPDAGFSGLVVCLRDISHIEEAEQQRRDFVANVSHELRSPLTVLAGFIETLRGPARNDPAAREEFLGIMEREAQRMARLVSDLLSLSRVESSEKVRPRAPLSLSEVLRATLAALRPQIEDAGITVDLRDLPDAPPIPGDRDQLVQVFHNLVENAIKYGGAGQRIEIEVSALDSVPGMVGPVLRVSVRDFGEGIDPIHIPRLTERFYRVDSHRAREMGGTGLGLAIVKHIVSRHRGKLTIRSERGGGSCFTVFLPCR